MSLSHIYDVVSRYHWIRRRIIPIAVIAFLLIPVFIPLLNGQKIDFFEIKSDILIGLVIMILLIMWDLMADQVTEPHIKGFSDAMEAQEYFRRIAEDNHKQTDMWLIQHSGENVHAILTEFLKRPEINNIHLLLHNPSTAVNKEQEDKIRDRLKNMKHYWKNNKGTVTCYHEHASVRGILLDGVALCLGWYVYEGVPNPRRSSEPKNNLIWGHDTGAIVVRSGSNSFEELCDFFKRTFEYLSDAPESSEAGDLFGHK